MYRGGRIGGFVLQSTFENTLCRKLTPFLIDKFIILASSSPHPWDLVIGARLYKERKKKRFRYRLTRFSVATSLSLFAID